MKNNTYYFLDMKKLKIKVDNNELLSELVQTNNTKVISKRLHELLHLLSYKNCTNFIRTIQFFNLNFDEVVDDIYIKIILLVYKFDITKSNHPFSYFTQCCNYEFFAIKRKNQSQSQNKFVNMSCNDDFTYDERLQLSKLIENFNKDLNLN